MLVSHRHQFIYTKTHKTAGTSVEGYFERYCLPPDEEFHLHHYRPSYESEHGIVGSRGKLYRGENPKWWNHMPASLIRGELGDAVWSRYYKFCVARNPYEKVVSHFFWAMRQEGRPTVELFALPVDQLRERFDDWLSKAQLIDDRERFMIGGEICMDDFIRYENLQADLERISRKLGIDYNPALMPEFKREFRPPGATAEALYTKQAREMIENTYAFELQYFGYGFPGGKTTQVSVNRTHPEVNQTEIIKALYLGLLGREADQGGMESYLARFNSPSDLPSIIAAMDGSPEHQQRMMAVRAQEIVEAVYSSALGRPADPVGMATYAGRVTKGDFAGCLDAVLNSREFEDSFRAKKRNVDFKTGNLEEEKIVFLHIPKTGGTTLHHLLSVGREDGEICPERHNGLHAFTAGELAGYRVFSGHFDYPSTKLIPGRKAVVTMLRDPVARLVSLYHFQKSHRDEVIERDGLRLARLAKDYSMLEFFALEEIRNHPTINNATTRMLSERVPSWRWESKRQNMEALSPTNLELALENLEEMSAFGLMEQYEDSVRIIFEKLCLPAPAEIPRKMVLDTIADEDPGLQRIEKEPLTPEVRVLLEGLVATDRKLYETAKEKFMNTLTSR